jgi:hypothetical protein
MRPAPPCSSVFRAALLRKHKRSCRKPRALGTFAITVNELAGAMAQRRIVVHEESAAAALVPHEASPYPE